METKAIMGIRPAVWEALRGRFVRMAIGLHGHSLRIITLPETSNDIGMTDRLKNVYLNPHHALTKMLPEPEAVMFMMGVFAHEDMHQQLTDFTLMENAGKKKPEHEQNIFHMICNIVEDPAIEHFASRFFGGKLLDAMNFTVMHLYKQGTLIDEAKTASEQFFSAMIQYGDGGILKGEFTFPEARKTFREMLPFFDKAIESFDSRKRLECMEKIFKISRPLWIDEVEALKEFMEMLKKLGKDHGSSSGRGNPDFKPGSEEHTETKTEKRRKVTFRKVSKEEADALKREGAAGDEIPEDGDIEVLLVEGGVDESEEGSERKVGIGGGSGDKDDKHEKTEAETTITAVTPDKDSEGGAADSEESSVITSDEFELTEERLKEIVAEVEAMLIESEAEKLEQAEADSEPIDVPELDKRYKGVRCQNRHVRLSRPEDLAATYAKVVQSLSGSISVLTSQFKRIFRADIEERERRTSGRLNIKRLTTGTPSSRVFDRKRLPSNKRDTVVILLIDESGSMRGPKVQVAKLTAILLAEVFAKVGITVKIIGFTDDGGHPLHYHYVSWKNTAQDRLKLLNISARLDNFDGYSIRYCGELLKKRSETHKMLIVVSDGAPVTDAYSTYGEGVADTRNAVREVSRLAKVFGVLIGCTDAETHHIMYGNDLLHINDINELPQRLAKKISTTIKNW